MEFRRTGALILLIIVSVYCSYVSVWSGDGGTEIIVGIIILLFFIFGLILCTSILFSFLRPKFQPVVLLVNLIILIGLPLIFYSVSWYMFNPLSSKGLRYEFKGGESSTWYSVQFYLKTGTTEIKGPWIGGGTLRLEFDDLNDDGLKDIKVLGTNGNAAEILFTPDKAKIWTIIKAKGYKVTWPEDGYNFG